MPKRKMSEWNALNYVPKNSKIKRRAERFARLQLHDNPFIGL